MTVAWAHDPGALGEVPPEDLAAFARRSPAARFASLAARALPVPAGFAGALAFRSPP